LSGSKAKLRELAERLNREVEFEKTFFTSALFNEQIPDLRNYLLETAQKGRWMFDESVVR
jgi:GTPase Era involved in 16S rRNA processing